MAFRILSDAGLFSERPNDYLTSKVGTDSTRPRDLCQEMNMT